MRLFNSLSRIGLSAAGDAALVTVAGAVFACGAALTALYLIDNIDETPGIRQLQCLVGIERADCPRQMKEMARLRQELATERARLVAMRNQIAGLESLRDRLASLEHSSESFTVFYDNNEGRHIVTTGHRYASLVEPEMFQSGWCYIDLDFRRGLATDLYIARINADLVVTPAPITDDVLVNAGLTRTEIADALRRCQWPDGA